MPIVSLTDTVTIRYTAALENGELMEKTDKPVAVSIGSGTICPAVEACLFGMEIGQSRVIRVQPEDAYGLHLPELVQDIPLTAFKGSKLTPQPGMILSLNVQREGQNCQIPATVTAVQNDTVTVDYNHPLAGQIIVYTVNLVSIAE
jgi:FKBP-type peptidyl-prolyl cis-trans isomerase SlpA